MSDNFQFSGIIFHWTNFSESDLRVPHEVLAPISSALDQWLNQCESIPYLGVDNRGTLLGSINRWFGLVNYDIRGEYSADAFLQGKGYDIRPIIKSFIRRDGSVFPRTRNYHIRYINPQPNTDYSMSDEEWNRRKQSTIECIDAVGDELGEMRPVIDWNLREGDKDPNNRRRYWTSLETLFKMTEIDLLNSIYGVSRDSDFSNDTEDFWDTLYEAIHQQFEPLGPQNEGHFFLHPMRSYSGTLDWYGIHRSEKYDTYLRRDHQRYVPPVHHSWYSDFTTENTTSNTIYSDRGERFRLTWKTPIDIGDYDSYVDERKRGYSDHGIPRHGSYKLPKSTAPSVPPLWQAIFATPDLIQLPLEPPQDETEFEALRDLIWKLLAKAVDVNRKDPRANSDDVCRWHKLHQARTRHDRLVKKIVSEEPIDGYYAEKLQSDIANNFRNFGDLEMLSETKVRILKEIRVPWFIRSFLATTDIPREIKMLNKVHPEEEFKKDLEEKKHGNYSGGRSRKTKGHRSIDHREITPPGSKKYWEYLISEITPYIVISPGLIPILSMGKMKNLNYYRKITRDGPYSTSKYWKDILISWRNASVPCLNFDLTNCKYFPESIVSKDLEDAVISIINDPESYKQSGKKRGKFLFRRTTSGNSVLDRLQRIVVEMEPESIASLLEYSSLECELEGNWNADFHTFESRQELNHSMRNIRHVSLNLSKKAFEDLVYIVNARRKKEIRTPEQIAAWDEGE